MQVCGKSRECKVSSRIAKVCFWVESLGCKCYLSLKSLGCEFDLSLESLAYK